MGIQRMNEMQESKYIHYHSGLKYQLARDAWFKTDIVGYGIETDLITLHDDGWLHIHRLYSWDGPSGPTKDTKSSMRGSLVHDALYQLIRQQLIPRDCRELADKELKKKCLADRMWEWRANSWFWFVRKFASRAAHPDNKRKVYTAP